MSKAKPDRKAVKINQTVLFTEPARHLLVRMADREGVTLSELMTRAICTHQAVNHISLWDELTPEQQSTLIQHYVTTNQES